VEQSTEVVCANGQVDSFAGSRRRNLRLQRLRCRGMIKLNNRNKLIEYKGIHGRRVSRVLLGGEVFASISLNGTYSEGRQLQSPHILFVQIGTANKGRTMALAHLSAVIRSDPKMKTSLMCFEIRGAGFPRALRKHGNRSSILVDSSQRPTHNAYEDCG
jgi:hypothetical protein